MAEENGFGEALDEWLNITSEIKNSSNLGLKCGTIEFDAITLAVIVIFSIICITGLVGNCLVIIVVLKYNLLKTVTNLYILNLSIADSLFLISLPAIVTNAITGTWMFGNILCKVFFAFDCVNKFTSAFTITVMAADRYMAACHPITSMRYRTSKYALAVIAAVWISSCFVMSPAIIYAKLTPCVKCRIEMPTTGFLNENSFTAYTLVLAFVIPVILICVFYTLIIVKLSKGEHRSTSHRRHCQFRKATRLVTLVIFVFILCWLPYWVMQVVILTRDSQQSTIYIFRILQVFTVLSYTNSMLNPLLYGFTNEYFRDAFNSAFLCVPDQSKPTRSSHLRKCEDAGNICSHLEAADACNKQPGTIEMDILSNADPFMNDETTRHSHIKAEDCAELE